MAGSLLCKANDKDEGKLNFYKFHEESQRKFTYVLHNTLAPIIMLMSVPDKEEKARRLMPACLIGRAAYRKIVEQMLGCFIGLSFEQMQDSIGRKEGGFELVLKHGMQYIQKSISGIGGSINSQTQLLLT